MNNFVSEFIEDFKNNLQSGLINPDLELNVVIDKKELDNDPNQENLKSELNKIGFDIKSDKKPNWFIITKISK